MSETVVIPEPPNRLVTERNHCSSEAWMCWSRYTEIPPSTSRRLISAMASRSVSSGREIASPSGPTCTCAPNAVPSSRLTRPVGVGALDLHLEGGPGEQLGDRSLPNHRAAIDDGHRVAGALDLVEEM